MYKIFLKNVPNCPIYLKIEVINIFLCRYIKKIKHILTGGITANGFLFHQTRILFSFYSWVSWEEHWMMSESFVIHQSHHGSEHWTINPSVRTCAAECAHYRHDSADKFIWAERSAKDSKTIRNCPTFNRTVCTL